MNTTMKASVVLKRHFESLSLENLDHIWVRKDSTKIRKKKSCNLYQTPITHKNQIYTKFKSQANVIFPKGDEKVSDWKRMFN